MKKVVILFIALGSFMNVFSQGNKSGHVTYEMVRKIEIKLEGSMAQYADMIPKEKKINKELLFNSEASIYRNIANENNDEEINTAAAGANVQIRMYQPDEFVYHDVKSKKNIEQREFLTRQFLITVNTDTTEWKITGKQKEILGYNCLEAELVGSEEKTLAWFNPIISVSTGPDGYTGLPGLIMAVDIGEGKTTYTAQKIDLKDVSNKEITKPKKGKKVTHAEYQAIQEEKRKEMQSSSGGNVIIYQTTE